ncbi:MAG: hypothetical protein IKE89_05230 [Bacilli bacterium]|nr:hypothetical protein [Bacilli bacterium]
MRNNFNVISIFIIFIIGLFILFIFSYNYKIKEYKEFNLIHLNNNKYELIVNINDLRLLTNNKTIYINNKKYKYKIIEVNRDVIDREKIKYNEVKISLDKSINEDIIVSYIFYKNNRLIDIFGIIYK